MPSPPSSSPADVPVVEPDELLDRIRAAAASGGRLLVGVAGAPGSGKSTTAAWLARRLDGAVVVPMDGFHLAQAVLDAAGTAERKGAPHTFDAAGFVNLLGRLRAPRLGEVVYAPRFDRDLEEPIAGAIAVADDVDIVVVEGNYLLVDEPPWDQVRPLLDVAVHVEVEAALRLERLVARHVAHGRTPEQARRWVEHNDELNAALVEAHRTRADALIRPAPDELDDRRAREAARAEGEYASWDEAKRTRGLE